MLGKLINTYHVYTARLNPALNGSSTQERFERSNAIEIHNGIMFDFYPGLPHICSGKSADREKQINVKTVVTRN